MKYLNSVLCTFILLMAVGLDMTPRAYELLSARMPKNQKQPSANFFISDKHYKRDGWDYVLVESGVPVKPGNYEVFEYQNMTIYVPKDFYSPLEIIDFKRNNGILDVGILILKAA